MSKVICLDMSVFGFRSINSWGGLTLKKLEGKVPPNTFIAPVGYNFFQMIIGTLKKIGVNKDDIILCCQDHWSWRKDVDANYKSQREEDRQKQTHINYPEKYKEINKVIDQLKESTNWQFLRLHPCEADDIMAVACRYYKDKEVIIVSIDADLKQLTHYPNVRFFSLLSKYKSVRGSYVPVDNPLKIISDKVRLGDVSDNILVSPLDTEHDFKLREEIINLLKLPENIENIVIKALDNLEIKENNYDKLPFPKSLAKRYDQIYDKKNVITYENVLEYLEKKELRAKKKKAKLKEEKKKLKKEEVLK